MAQQKTFVIYKPTGRAGEIARLACNLYDGCVHGCRYCYVPAIQHKDPEVFHRAAAPRKDILARLEVAAAKFTKTKHRVLFCFTCDPYQPVAVEGLTGGAIEILRRYDIPFQILTKAGLAATVDFDKFTDRDMFGVTLTLLDAIKCFTIEPKAASPTDRIVALELAKDKKIKTFVSLEPVVDPDVSLEIIRHTHAVVDHYHIGKMNHQDESEDLSAYAWRTYAEAAIKLCEHYGVTYYVKKDLAKFLDGLTWTDTDIRTVT